MENPWLQLIKGQLSLLVVCTTAGGYLLAGGSLFDWHVLCGVTAGTAMCAASANTFNEVIEVKHDAKMLRTRKRPLVTGAISMDTARAFGYACGIGGTALLYVTTTPTTAALGAFTLVLYTHAYTPLKRITKYNTEVGAIVGAIPPVMGWTAAFGVTGVGHYEALFLAGYLFAWQMHHFMSIAWLRREDYIRGGYWMRSRGDDSGTSTAGYGLCWAGTMFTLPLIAHVMSFTTVMFTVSGTVVNTVFFYYYYQFYRQRTNASAMRALKAGLVQLFVFFALMVFHLSDHDRVTAFGQLSELREMGVAACAYHKHKFLGSRSAMCPAPQPGAEGGEDTIKKAATCPFPIISTGNSNDKK